MNCGNCGQHVNDAYQVTKSAEGTLFTCKDCTQELIDDMQQWVDDQ